LPKVIRQSVAAPFLLLLTCAASHAQIPIDTGPKLTPQAAYEQAARPFDIVRRAPQNWSEVEIAAYTIAVGQAKNSCLASSPKEFAADDLLAYARLCTLGQAWEPVELAAYKYIQTQPIPASSGPAMRSLASAYDYEVQAALRLKKPVVAYRSCQTMLSTVPYDDLASEAVNSTVPYLELSDTNQALALLKQRQPILLAMLRGAAAPEQPAAPVLPQGFAVRTLYAEATALPAMQQFANQPEAAAAAFAELEQALPPTLAPDDTIAINESRRRYGLLGARVPKIDTFAWLWDSTGKGIPPDLNGNFGQATVLLVFPDWCSQCVALQPQFTPAWTRLRQSESRFFVLLAQDKAPPKPAPVETQKPSGKAGTGARFPGEKPEIPHNELHLDVKPTPAALLAGSPTFAVPTKTLADFAANDFPLIVIADHDGIIRVVELGNETILAEGGQIDQLVDHVLQKWPATGP